MPAQLSHFCALLDDYALDTDARQEYIFHMPGVNKPNIKGSAIAFVAILLAYLIYALRHL
jgi:hypothetical protein